MAVSSKDFDLAKIREATDADLAKELKEAKETLFNLRFQAATGQLTEHSRLKQVRRDIARIYTVMSEREHGIMPGPAETGGES